MDAWIDAQVEAKAEAPSVSDAADEKGAQPDGPDASAGEVEPDGPLDRGVGDALVEGGADEGGWPADAGGDCGAGCPSTISPDSLRLWLAADWGVACDGDPSRVVSWSDRANVPRAFSPPAGHSGPLCEPAQQAWAGRMVPFFDRLGVDDQDSVLPIDLSALMGADGYSVFVVERRRSAVTPSYLLGSDVPAGDAVTRCGGSGNEHQAYRFGYRDAYFFAGDYGIDADENCTDSQAMSPIFDSDVPIASLDVEVFSPQSGRALYFGTNLQVAIDNTIGIDMTGIQALQVGQYLGRAYQQIDGNMDARFLGEIAEVVIYQAALDDTARLAVSRYLMDRWQIAEPPP
jgi:hypothetical protein